jgi:hypothetical protein
VGDATVGTATVVGCAAADTGSAAEVACGFLSGLAGSTFTLTACDGSTGTTAVCARSIDVGMRMTIPRSQLALGDILGFFDAGTMVAEAVMRKETVP